jgi:serine protease Do
MIPFAFAGAGEELAAVAERLSRGTVHVGTGGHGGGGAIVWSSDGLLVTNAHVATATDVGVRMSDARTLPGRVVARDPWRDLAAIRIDAGDLEPVARAPSAAALPGTLAIALGHPLGWPHALSVGVLHHVERIGADGPPRWLRADVRLLPGNSGGPLADADGRVLGINAMVVRGTALAIPVEAIDAFLDADRPRLGVALRPARVARATGERFGMLVVAVTAGSSADRAGMRPGDAIVEIDGRPLSAPTDVGQLLHAVQSEAVVVAIVRAGRSVALTANVAPRTGARAA